ncbi:GNAT family N-acetyltransferase [Actinoplanes sp. NPDC023714]|uniref:GNAT family N-acetyltransferase n=1 Tax=Actinoplanes sp. NPDC023714 TaxID=3154322 RepID=UPI0033E3CCF0
MGMHVGNAAAMWASKGPDSVRGDDYLLAEHDTGARVILVGGAARAAEVLALAPRRTLIVEDAFGILGAHEPGTLRMPIMVRRPGRVVAAASRVRVEEVRDEAGLAAAERVIVDGFPLPAHQPWRRGGAMPADVLGRPGWRVWLGRCDGDGEPAAAAYTFDDGTAVGVYWLATLPEHRSKGAGRAVLTTALAAAPDRHFTLIATEAGLPLYESAGFAVAGTSVWHTRPPLEG